MHGSVIAHIVLSHNLLNVLSGFLCVVERHVGEKMMGNVCVCNMVEIVVEEGAPRAVNGRHGSAQPRPFTLVKMRHVNIRVVKISECH